LSGESETFEVTNRHPHSPVDALPGGGAEALSISYPIVAIYGHCAAKCVDNGDKVACDE
jgi:hypothetical protein